jgi:hypothetical protein
MCNVYMKFLNWPISSWIWKNVIEVKSQSLEIQKIGLKLTPKEPTWKHFNVKTRIKNTIKHFVIMCQI